MIRVHLLDAAGHLAPGLAGEVRALAETAVAAVDAQLGIDGADLVLCDYRGLAIPELGVGGYAPSAALAFIALEPWGEHFAQHWRQALPASIAHELHHVRRWQGPGYGPRLADSLVSEGMATLFEAERTGEEPLYARAVPGEDLDRHWQDALPLLEREDQHARFFFGGADLPRWLGYALGTELARRYCREHGVSAAEAVDAPAGEVAKAW